MSAVAALWLREVTLDAYANAISRQQDTYLFCPDCETSPSGQCAGHERAHFLVREFEVAREQIRAAGSDTDVLAILRGTDGGRPAK